MADWRKRFFLAPGTSSTKGAPMADNSKLFNATGVWNAQNLGGTLNYIPNYDAILAWLKTGPQTLPPSLRAGRVCYYTAIPSSIPMNWSTGIISSSASLDQRFWKGYIDFVIGCGEHNRAQTLYGYGSNNTWGSSTFGTGKITPAANLTGTTKPYMAYDDCPVHPRLHMWFGPLDHARLPVDQFAEPGLQLVRGDDVRGPDVAAEGRHPVGPGRHQEEPPERPGQPQLLVAPQRV